jgi:hypothetical protein
MKINIFVLSVIVIFFHHSNTFAYELGVGARSMGQVVEVSKKLGDSFNIRIAIGSDYNSGDIEYSSSDEIEVESVLFGDMGQWNASHLSALIDYHPWQGNFRLTLGLTENSLSWMVQNTGVDSFTFNDKTHGNDIVESTELEVQFTDGISPYVGFGWATGFDKISGFSFNGDIGVFAASDFVVLFDANCTKGQETSADCESVKQDAKYELAELQEGEKISLLPLIGLGVSYKF